MKTCNYAKHIHVSWALSSASGLPRGGGLEILNEQGGPLWEVGTQRPLEDGNRPEYELVAGLPINAHPNFSLAIPLRAHLRWGVLIITLKSGERVSIHHPLRGPEVVVGVRWKAGGARIRRCC